ncbi:MAG: NAD(P)/FAD-dependent oxidoreductase [Deltaproteobacteria bacterium]|nr:NAD(P)/FAD-dependent oxidoreductase [Deltaproteobacteria bacterium]
MEDSDFDVIILGSGPAGLQAAIHAARRKASVLVLGRVHKSSAFTAHIENYICIGGEAGGDLLKQASTKAAESGAALLEEDVMELARSDGEFSVRVESGRTFRARALILAMGVSRNKLGVRGEKELLGKGVSYCVDCDAGFYREADVAVVGCGSAAVSGALTLIFYAREVHLVCDELDVADYLNERLKESTITIHENVKVVEIEGNDTVSAILFDDGTKLNVSGVFIEQGAKGATTLLANLGVSLDTETLRYITTNKKQETNIPGIYAAGDICGPPWQVAKAVGEGCVAGLEAAPYARKLASGKTG